MSRSFEQVSAAEILDGHVDALEIVPPDRGRNVGAGLPDRRRDAPERRQAVVVVQGAAA
jgi:hypothetical protein